MGKSDNWVGENVYVRGKVRWGVPENYALLGGAGNSSVYLDSHENKNFLEYRLRSNYAGGDIRGMYMRVQYNGAGGGGEPIRAYAQATAAVGTIHGAHVTGEIASGGSVTGLIAGLRATAATASGLTLSGGTMAALQIDTSLASAVSGMTAASLIRIAESQTNKMPYFIISDGMTGCIEDTFTGNVAKMKALKCNFNGTAFWLPIQTATS